MHQIATVTAKGQITIPKAIRQILGIEEQDRLLFLIEGDRLLLVPLRRRPLSQLYRALPATRPYPGQQAIREEVRSELGERIAGGEE
jgi:AbrB family looped-hinge helix DNA binding protein